MRFTRPEPFEVSTLGVTIIARIQIGLPSYPEEDGSILISLTDEDAAQKDVDPIEVVLPLASLTTYVVKAIEMVYP